MEEVIQKQMEEYIRDKNVIPEEHHGSTPGHNTLTVKISIDEEVNRLRNSGNNAVVLSTDLSAAYDTVDHCLLLVKLEHVGFRGIALKLMTSYLLERYIYVEVQGATGKLMPNKSVIQG